MPLSPNPDAAIDHVRDSTLSLPDTEERLSHGQPTFFVAGKMFAQFRHDHHGDGRTVLVVKTGSAEERDMLIEANPDRYSRPAYFRADWVSVDIGSVDTDWEHVDSRIAQSWELAAPRRLLEAGGR